jgi:hypothetical protein
MARFIGQAIALALSLGMAIGTLYLVTRPEPTRPFVPDYLVPVKPTVHHHH